MMQREYAGGQTSNQTPLGHGGGEGSLHLASSAPMLAQNHHQSIPHLLGNALVLGSDRRPPMGLPTFPLLGVVQQQPQHYHQQYQQLGGVPRGQLGPPANSVPHVQRGVLASNPQSFHLQYRETGGSQQHHRGNNRGGNNSIHDRMGRSTSLKSSGAGRNTLNGGGPLSTGNHDFIRKSDLAGWRTRSLYPCVRPPPGIPGDGGGGKAFLPVLKLRGLPYFCTGRHISSWFGDWASAILNLMLIPDVQPFNTGFAIVTMASPQAAFGAWKTLHREPITNRRFVEVFALVPPHCPLIKRNGSAANTDLQAHAQLLLDQAKMGAVNEISISAPSTTCSSPTIVAASSSYATSGASATAAASSNNNGGGGTNTPAVATSSRACNFCGALLSYHGDGGLSSVACSRLAKFTLGISHGALSGLMPIGYLQVPALLYTDTTSTSQEEVAEFMPLEWEMRNAEEAAIYRQHLVAFEGRGGSAKGAGTLDLLADAKLSSTMSSVNDLFNLSLAESSLGVFALMNQLSPYPPGYNLQEAATCQYFFQLDRIQGYDVRILLIEIVSILGYLNKPVSLVAIGNRLSTRARAYLFVIETKLQTILERFPDIFIVQSSAPSLRVQLNFNGPLAAAADGSIYSLCHAIYETPALNLSRKSRRGRTRGDNRRPRRQPSETNAASLSLFDSRPPSPQELVLKAVDEDQQILPPEQRRKVTAHRLLDDVISQRDRETLEASIFTSGLNHPSLNSAGGAGDLTTEGLAGDSTATSTTSGTGIGLQGDSYSPVADGTPILSRVGSSVAGGFETPGGASYYESAALKLGRYLSATTTATPPTTRASGAIDGELLLRRTVTTTGLQRDLDLAEFEEGGNLNLGRFVNDDDDDDWFGDRQVHHSPSELLDRSGRAGGGEESIGRGPNDMASTRENKWEGLLEPLDLKRSATEQPPARWETNTRSWEHNADAPPLDNLMEYVCPYSPCMGSIEFESLYRSITSPHDVGENNDGLLLGPDESTSAAAAETAHYIHQQEQPCQRYE